MAMISSAAVTRDWSNEVAELARAEGVEHYLPAVLEMTRRLFPAARRLEVNMESDWEIANQRYIVLDVEVIGWDMPQAVAARRQWMQELGRCCPSPRPGPFVLALELVK